MLQLVLSKDGSPTFYDDVAGECYHSQNGALSESQHVFIHNGLEEILKRYFRINLLEVGFGTGLNAWLSWKEIEKREAILDYTTLEPFPLSLEQAKQFTRNTTFSQEEKGKLLLLHEAKPETAIPLSQQFIFTKLFQRVENLESNHAYHLVYFDAFSPDKAPELWTGAVFESIYHKMTPGGILVTYCAKGVVKRTLKGIGFRVEALKGAAGKREMTRAIKPD